MNQTILLFKLSTENHRKIGKHCREDPYLNQNPTANWVTSTRWFCKNACGPVCLMRVGEKQKLWTIITINHCQSLIIIINHYQPFITIDYQPLISPGLVFVRPALLLGVPELEPGHQLILVAVCGSWVNLPEKSRNCGFANWGCSLCQESKGWKCFYLVCLFLLSHLTSHLIPLISVPAVCFFIPFSQKLLQIGRSIYHSHKSILKPYQIYI